MPKLFCFLMIAAAANAQTLSVGILGGADFNNVVSGVNLGSYTPVVTEPPTSRSVPRSRRTFRSICGWKSMRSTARLGSICQAAPPDLTPFPRSSGVFPSSWDIASKVSRSIHPFVEAGLSFDHLAGLSDAAKSVIVSGPGTLLHQSNADFVVGGGVDVKIPFIRLSGELRYSRATVSDFAASRI